MNSIHTSILGVISVLLAFGLNALSRLPFYPLSVLGVAFAIYFGSIGVYLARSRRETVIGEKER